MTKNISRALITAALIAARGIAQTPASDFAAAQKQFDSLCEGCHGQGGNGGDRAPALVNNRSLRTRNEAQIRDLIKSGTSGGMPAFKLPEGELQSLTRWLRSLNMSAFDTKPSGNAMRENRREASDPIYAIACIIAWSATKMEIFL
jgi:mono/diheme cytochrome c family protein